jgi:hypothetical protein
MIASGSAARIQSTAARMSWSEIWEQWQMIMGLTSGMRKTY